MSIRSEWGSQADELGGSDPSDYDPKKEADERKKEHYPNKGGHQKRGEENKKGGKK